MVHELEPIAFTAFTFHRLHKHERSNKIVAPNKIVAAARIKFNRHQSRRTKVYSQSHCDATQSDKIVICSLFLFGFGVVSCTICAFAPQKIIIKSMRDRARAPFASYQTRIKQTNKKK